MFATGSMIKNWKIKNISDGITQVHELYLKSGLNITHMHADRYPGPLCREITALCINLNCASKKENFPKIEPFIRTVKERVRSAWSTMQFKRLYKLMIVHLFVSAIFWINEFTYQYLLQDFQTQKVPDNLYLELWSTTKKFADYIQENMFRCINRMNTATWLISTLLLERSS